MAPSMTPGRPLVSPAAVSAKPSSERQLLLAIVPLDHAKKHPAPEHLGLDVGGVFLPVRRIANAKPWILALLFLRIVGSERAAHRLIHQRKATVRELLIVHRAPTK